MGVQNAARLDAASDFRLQLSDDTPLPVASLQHVLKGVIVATKAPSSVASSLENFFNRHATSARNRRDSGVGTLLGDRVTVEPKTLNDWLEAMSLSLETSILGTREVAQITLAISLLRENARANIKPDAATLDCIWSLINDAIANDSSQGVLTIVPSRSAQGFMSVALCSLLSNGRIDELWRFHVWLPDHRRGVSEVSIHAHQPFAQSWILAGRGLDISYDGNDVNDPQNATHAAYECQWRPNNPNTTNSSASYQTHQVSSTVKRTSRLIKATATDRHYHSRDMTYSVPGGAYHRSIVPGDQFHATLFVFDASRGYDENAAVLGPLKGDEYTQLRDPGGVTAQNLACMTDAMRELESHRDDEQDFSDLAAAACRNYEALVVG